MWKGLALMFSFCSSHRMSTTILADPPIAIPPCPVALRGPPGFRFVPAQPARRVVRRAMRDFTGFLALAWAMAELALWVAA
jgi:hypothetical protein